MLGRCGWTLTLQVCLLRCTAVLLNWIPAGIPSRDPSLYLVRLGEFKTIPDFWKYGNCIRTVVHALSHVVNVVCFVSANVPLSQLDNLPSTSTLRVLKSRVRPVRYHRDGGILVRAVCLVIPAGLLTVHCVS